MSDTAKLTALAGIAALKKEADLMAVARADAERGQVMDRVKALDRAVTASRQAPVTDIASLAARESFGRLIASQRAGLDRQLAEKTDLWRIRRDAAALSFGRSQVLERLRERVAEQAAKRRGGGTL